MQIDNVIKMLDRLMVTAREKPYLYPFRVIMIWYVEYASEGHIRTNIESRHPTVIKHKSQ